ncbi:MAG: hypothetical protein QOF53_2674 [Nocardioidaceae bacterium]|jgi:hypothetical protein|nr:hypothetical protein [Nocardioidaceae bacterium]
MAQPLFEVRVAGVVPDTDLRDLRAVTLAPDQVSTVLYGIDDQAALYGLLARLRSLGIDVMEVRRVSDLSVSDDSDDGPATESDEENRA